jgi:hypothetical protein
LGENANSLRSDSAFSAIDQPKTLIAKFESMRIPQNTIFAMALLFPPIDFNLLN